LEDIPETLVAKSAEIVLLEDKPLSPENVRSYALNLHTKRPLVTFGMRTHKKTSTFTHMEEEWLPTFIQSGASGTETAACRIDARADSPTGPEGLLDTEQSSTAVLGNCLKAKRRETLPFGAFPVCLSSSLGRKLAQYKRVTGQCCLHDLVEIPVRLRVNWGGCESQGGHGDQTEFHFVFLRCSLTLL
jgi:hypothetical protein